jgi:hypothetical protein
VDSRPVPPSFARDCAARFGEGFAPAFAPDFAARFGEAVFLDFFAEDRPFGAADLFCVAFFFAGRAGFRALVEPLLPFFGAALRGAFFAIGFSLTERP